MVNNIYTRNRNECIDAVTLLWRAFTNPNPQKTLKKYMAKDGLVILPDGGIVSPETEPPLEEWIEDFEPWTAYKMDSDEDEMKFVEIDMMSTSLTYQVTVWRQLDDDPSRMMPTEMICSTILKQEPGGDWKACVHHMASL